MSATRYKEEFIIKFLKCGEVIDEYTLEETLIKELLESVRHIMGSHWSMHSAATLCKLALPPTLLRALHQGDDVLSEKEGDHQKISINRGGRREQSPSTARAIKTDGSTPAHTATSTTIASAVMHVGSSPLSIATPTTHITDGSCQT